MRSTFALVGILMVIFLEQDLVASLCPCALHFPANHCSCQAGPAPICSCQAIVPTPSCGCAVQTQVTECRTSCQQICQSTCAQSSLFLTCPSSCGSACMRSCMPQFLPVAIPRVAITTQCPGVCQQSCHKFCAVRTIPACIPQCQQTCVRKCAVATSVTVPIQKTVSVIAQPNPAVLLPGPLAVPTPGCTGCAQKQHALREAMSFPDMVPLNPAQPRCVEACMPDCDPDCVMQHRFISDEDFATPSPAAEEEQNAVFNEEQLLTVEKFNTEGLPKTFFRITT
ncbi:hypothetical protein ANCDUO_08127 [Ancylostoma duodenale]|uniref:Cysteine rich repeat-containing domain protein n=1 Tax=Ancylostoma duodenale TaxID=51022 RepID=A0A0C2DGM0_9BILA|nr:hypothetical protein ANCDUO_08127 [Ancylostoma duodenale]